MKNLRKMIGFMGCGYNLKAKSIEKPKENDKFSKVKNRKVLKNLWFLKIL